MATTQKIKGTSFDTFKVGKRGAQLKKSSATRMSVRDEADSALANMEGADPLAAQDFLTRAYFEANVPSGAGDPSKTLGGIHPLLGEWAAWTGKSKLATNEAFWAKIWLPEGTYDRMECAIVNGASAGRTVDMGIYANTAGAPSGSPLVSTGAQDTAGANNTFFRKAFSAAATLVVPAGGLEYWVAIASSNGSIEFSSTHHNHQKVWRNPLYREKASYGATLGAVPTFDAAADSVFIYMGVLEQ